MRPYHAYTPDQAFLLPASLLDAIDTDDPVHVVRQVVRDLDLTAFHRAYEAKRGRPPFHPEAMVGLCSTAPVAASTPRASCSEPAARTSPSCT